MNVKEVGNSTYIKNKLQGSSNCHYRALRMMRERKITQNKIKPQNTGFVFWLSQEATRDKQAGKQGFRILTLGREMH